MKMAGSDSSFPPPWTTATGKKSEQALRKQNQRLRLLWETAGILLSTDSPDAMLQGLFEKVGGHLGVDSCFNYMVNETGTALRLQFSSGVPEDVVTALTDLEFGQAICGTVARERRPIVASFVQQSSDPRWQLVRELGLHVYACNPLIAGDQLLGTLSFGSRTRAAFDDEELEFIQTISHYVTVAYERLRLLSELRQTDSRKNEFLAILAHELRNPLAPVRNAVEFLRIKGLNEPDVAWAYDMIDRQVTNLVRLIDDLLEISRINRGKIELRKESTSLSRVLSQAIEASRPALEEKGHILRLDLCTDLLPVFGDPTRLEQVFVNLITNAGKYTDVPGTISVSTRRIDAVAVISVRDNGIGIPPEMLRAIFEPFVQVDHSLARTRGGLGIGLTLVKSLSEMHGGTVEAASAGPGTGSEFTVRLPLIAEPAWDAPAESACT